MTINQAYARPQDGEAAHRQRVLVVDDHELGRKSLARLLDAMGYEVIAANDGESALDAMKRSGPLDFVLTDLRLPDLDGRDVVQAARQLVPLPRIALITGWDVEESEARRLGLNWVFLKPLNVPEIVKKLRQARSTGDEAPEIG